MTAMAQEHDLTAILRIGMPQIWDERDWAATERYFAPDIIIHFPTEHGPINGREAFKPLWERLQNAFSDITFTIEKVAQEGDVVAGRWTMRGTHTGLFRGLPPTGIQVEVDEFAVLKWRGEVIEEMWLMPNLLGLMQQLGAAPTAPPPKAAMAMMRLMKRMKRHPDPPAPPSYASH